MWLRLVAPLLMTGISLQMDPSDWMAINDGVMGGVSSGRMTASGEHLQFTGELSLENNGGFASVRRQLEGCPPGTYAVRLEVRGDGRNYQLRLRQDLNFDGIAWRAEFAAVGDWQHVELPLTSFEPVFRGRRVSDAGSLNPSAIRQLGFMLADKKPGPFRLEVRTIEWLVADGESP